MRMICAVWTPTCEFMYSCNMDFMNSALTLT